ncbi:hypothetical protein [Yoonia maritima]|uniref:hypothetical protein n=1 Tax=Yoonia maritima TaxID=1435347 RepID=UPI0037365F9D
MAMPSFQAFRSPESYCATLAHEMTHNAEVGIMPRRSSQAVAQLEVQSRMSA